jgi:DNA polymerase III epsilon subunit-like protein
VVALLHDYRDTRDTERYTTFKSTPASSISKPKLEAVVLDCEMAGVAGGASEVISICAVDYLTGAVLLNKLVCPTGKVTSWRSSIHGITKATMLAAVASGEVLAGWNSARQEVWKLIDDNTILVGHALQHDLDSLRIIHHRVVDSAILARNAVGSARQWGLHVLCNQLLHKKIRENSRGLHDCLEDVLATREVALLCTRDKERLRNWAEVAKADEERKVNERKVNERKAARLRKQAARETVEGEDSADIDLYPDYSSETEIIYWSDVAEDFGWPHPDTGYDPWSD